MIFGRVGIFRLSFFIPVLHTLRKNILFCKGDRNNEKEKNHPCSSKLLGDAVRYYRLVYAI